VTREDSKIRITTPKCYVPFGVSTYDDKQSLDVSLKDAKFVKFLRELDEMVNLKGQEQSEQWFGNHADEHDVESIYKSMVRPSKGDFPPTLRAKLPLESTMFDVNNTRVYSNQLTKGSYVQLVIECVGVYAIKKEFGATWKIVQAKIYPSTKVTGYAFVDEDEDVDPV